MKFEGGIATKCVLKKVSVVVAQKLVSFLTSSKF